MKGIDWRGAAVALAAGFGGAAIAVLLDLPAAALLGSTLAVTVACFLRLNPVVPDRLRDIGFCVIGVSLGSGVTPDIWSEIAHWPLSLAMLALTVLVVMLSCAFVLQLFFGPDTQTALLATSPGALSYTLALASERNADLRFVMVLQSLRLVLITVFLPPAIGFTEGGVQAARDGALPHLAYGEVAILLVATFALGWTLVRWRFPAAYILAGLLLSGIAHGAGLVSGRPADPVTFFGFSVTGAMIGARFAGITFAELKRLSVAGLISTFVAVAISIAGAVIVSLTLDLPFGQVWVSFAPGGVEGMSSMGLALGYDPVYVATHHVFRILLLIAFLPVLLRLFEKKT